MNPYDQLSDYLQRVEGRLKLAAWARGIALVALCALLLTVVLVLVANAFAFSSLSLTFSRTVLYIALAVAVGFGLLTPLLKLNARRAAREAEERFPEFQERLLTFAERRGAGARDAFLDLLAADALQTAARAAPREVAGSGKLLGFLSAGAGSAALLLWLGASGPGFWGYGTSLLWAGPARQEAAPFYSLRVEPGSRTVRKRADQLITAQTFGFVPGAVRLSVRYASASKWEDVPMRPRSGAPGFEFLFSGIPETLDYYVSAGALRSETYRLTVTELPAVRKIKVTYRYPAWTGFQETVEDPGGDLHAVEGTVAQVEVETDRPLANGFLLIDGTERVVLSGGQADVPIRKDGVYYVAARDRDEDVRLTDDYFIQAVKDSAPQVRLVRPGRDAKVSPIEELPVVVEAADDFGLQELKLVYSVNGGEPKTVSLLSGRGGKQATGRTLLSLEDFHLAPGDIVSMYATARDANSSAQTDIYFAEAQPFERNFSQSQVSGQGGGEQDDQQQISTRQKEIIVAAWNEIRGGKPGNPSTGAFLSDVQGKLRDQAKSLSNRMRSRALAGANQEIKTFVKEMDAAVEAMGPSAEKLKATAWKDALPPAQKALQHLLRAESVFRDIQVAFNSRGGGGAGGNLGRELESLFDLELDTDKNQYETEQRSASGGDQRQKEIDEALARLEQLARRQQELAEQQQRNQHVPQQRWQQELLRREAEELKRQMEQLARGTPSPPQQSSQRSNSQASSSSPQSSSPQSSSQQQSQQQSADRAGEERQYQSDPRRTNQQQLQRALEQLQQATRDMQNAMSTQRAGTPQSEAEARRAADRLREARDVLSGMRKREAGDQLGQLSERAARLAGRQRDFSERLMKEFGQAGAQGGAPQAGGKNREKNEQLAREKEGMSQDLQRLEKEIQEAARALAGADKVAANKLRKALGDLQQEEVARNMRWSAEAIRRGYGAYATMREGTTTYALDNLRERLKEAADSLERGKAGDQGLEEALRQAESLRQQMERMAKSLGARTGQREGSRPQSQRQPGQQPGQPGQPEPQPGGQPGERGQQQAQAGQRPGQEPGQGHQPGQQGPPGLPGPGGRRGETGGEQMAGPFQPGGRSEAGGWGGMNRGERLAGDGGAYDAQTAERVYRDTMRDLTRLRQQLGDTPEISAEIQDLLREMARLDPKRFPGNPELVNRLDRSILAGLENLELMLRRKLDEKGGGSVRATSPPPVPPEYSRSIAEYFRRLSKQ